MIKFINPEYLFALYFFNTKKKKCKIPDAYKYAGKIVDKIEEGSYFNVNFQLSLPAIEKMVHDYPDAFELKEDKIIRKCDLLEIASRFIPYIPNDILIFCF